MITGINYPWTVFDGRANYGCDFGRNRWDCHTGVTANLDAVRSDFAQLAAARIDVARWFVFTDGRGGIDWTSGREIAGLDGDFFSDMDAALEIAASNGVRLCLVLLDFLWFDDPSRRLALLDRRDESPFVDRVLDPFLDRYGKSPVIHSFDLINEPDWIVDELATDGERAAWPIERLRQAAAMMSQQIRRRSAAAITIGGGRMKATGEWDNPIYDLDFIQIHSYPERRHPSRAPRVFQYAAAEFGVSKPILIGEFAASNVTECIARADAGGYIGAWPWSFKGTDSYGSARVPGLTPPTET